MALTGDAAGPANTDALVAAAVQARRAAYAPYSNYHVGAALQAQDGQIYVGVNVESASYGLTVCAERNAIAAAAAAGVRPGQVVAVAVAAEGALASVSPCGACRQVLHGWAAPGARLTCCALPEGATRTLTVAELLPHAFVLTPRATPAASPA